MMFRRFMFNSNSISQVRRYATNNTPSEGKKRWFRAEFISIAVPFAVLVPFLFYDEPFVARKKKQEKLKN